MYFERKLCTNLKKKKNTAMSVMFKHFNEPSCVHVSVSLPRSIVWTVTTTHLTVVLANKEQDGGACFLNPDLKCSMLWLWSQLCFIRGSCCRRFWRDKRKDQFLDQGLDLPHLPVTALTESSLEPVHTPGILCHNIHVGHCDREETASESAAELKLTQFNYLQHPGHISYTV